MKAEDIIQPDLPAEDRPFTDEEWARANPIHPLVTWRTMIKLNEHDFCQKFGITPCTLENWESWRVEMDEDILVEVNELLLQARERFFEKHHKDIASKWKQGDIHTDANHALYDLFAIEKMDNRRACKEDHYILIGMGEVGMMAVTYTYCYGKVKVISARKAERHERRRYFTANPPRR